MSEEKTVYWFGFRQTHPKPPGIAVPVGPFESYEEALAKREQTKAWDCDVSTPFLAETKEEAMEEAKKWM